MLVQNGVAELQSKLGRLKGKDGKAAVRKGCRASAKVVQRELKTTVPRRSGNMARKIAVRALKRKKGREGVRVALDARNAKGEPYGYFLERGTKVHIGARIRRRLSGRRAGSEIELRKSAIYQSLDFRIRPRHYMEHAAETQGHTAIRIGQETMRDEIERRMAI